MKKEPNDKGCIRWLRFATQRMHPLSFGVLPLRLNAGCIRRSSSHFQAFPDDDCKRLRTSTIAEARSVW